VYQSTELLAGVFQFFELGATGVAPNPWIGGDTGDGGERFVASGTPFDEPDGIKLFALANAEFLAEVGGPFAVSLED